MVKTTDPTIAIFYVDARERETKKHSHLKQVNRCKNALG